MGAALHLPTNDLPTSRHKHRESDIWQRSFWEHVLRDEDDLRQHVDYIHYVKHRVAACPHGHMASSFHAWARWSFYPNDWLCVCGGNKPAPPTFARIHPSADE